MSDARLFVLPLEATTFAPLEDLVRALMTQGLVDPGAFCHAVPSDGTGLATTGLVVRTLGRTSEEDEHRELNEWVLDHADDDFVLVNLVTADSLAGADQRRSGTADRARGEFGDPAPELSMAIQVEQVIRPAIDQDAQEGSVLHVLNLVFPAATPSSMPWDLWWRGSGAEPWRNVIVAPEVQIKSHTPTVLVDFDEDYVTHVATGMLVLAGAWSGVGKADAIFSVATPTIAVGYEWMLVKTRARTVMAPELPRRVLGRIGNAAREVPVDDTGAIEFAIDPEPNAPSPRPSTV